MKDIDNRFPVYSRILNLYPKSFRDKYKSEMLQTTADMLDGSTSTFSKAFIWSRLALDFPVSVGRQQFIYLGGILHSETPNYIKRNSLISAVLLLPFFIALSANGLDRVINNRTLFNSWVWRANFITLWFFLLPELALLIFIGSYAVFVLKDRNKDGRSLRNRILDIKHSWPIVATGLMALSILFMVLFHDSAQCLVHTPNYLAGHISQTWECAAPSAKLIHRVFLPF